MAYQDTIFKLRGSIGDLSFYKDKRTGYQVRRKGGPSREQVLNTPELRRTRENAQEFGRAAQASKRVRSILKRKLSCPRDSKFCQRMNSRMVKIIKADQIHGRGERQVMAENMEMLLGFDCNEQARLSDVLFLKIPVQYDRFTGKGTLIFPQFRPSDKILPVANATHVQLRVLATEFGMDDDDTDRISMVSSEYLDIRRATETVSPSLSFDLYPRMTSVVLIWVGVAYYSFVNDGYHPLSDLQHDTLAIVHVDIP
ncbi:hypothetical protein G5B00_15620 [Parapedobacter sp. SGR-10]|uniref:hypothetical protein n=1 Tax=Parapedobacter sp. SGR-10 TaxID=2710879 RepID=UPI0013D1DF88|nr:hypothetical protein [Parapedobacter sp. SGR-10]NGF57948.1 hypothetical protein [Parapedobacter sp. SGR-10]